MSDFGFRIYFDIETRCKNAQPAPWTSYIENRDHDSGCDFIMTGEGDNRGEDIQMLGATVHDYDFIASARQDIPRLVQEIRRLQFEISEMKKLIPDS